MYPSVLYFYLVYSHSLFDDSQWNKSQKAKKPARILLPSSSSSPSTSKAANKLGQSSKGENIGDLKLAIAGIGKESMVSIFQFLLASIHYVLQNKPFVGLMLFIY